MMRISDIIPKDTLDIMADVHGFFDFMNEHPEKMDMVDTIFRRLVPRSPLVEHDGFYTMRLFTPEGADYFLAASDRMADKFKPNDDEGLDYQIPEIVLYEYPELLDELSLASNIGSAILWPLFHLMYGERPNHYSSIQLARYSGGGTRGTGWHNDSESEATCVVSLAPERHTGGGTAIRPRGALAPAVLLPPLPKGHALLFNGRCTLHKGAALESGERNLLVYWMTNK